MILITGATGLVGSHLCLHLLENGLKIKAMYRDVLKIENTKTLFDYYNKNHLFESIEWIKADILDIPQLEIAFQNITSVYHCAALISFDPRDEEKLRKTNIEGTANIVNFCIEKKIEKLCHVSSIAALGSKKDHESHINENSEWNPNLFHSDYALSKYGAEMEVWRAKQEGVNVVIVNPGVILSQPIPLRDWDDGSSKLFLMVKNGLKFYTNGKTGFVVIEDVVAIMYLLMNDSRFGEQYCLISENKSYKGLVTEIANAINLKAPRFEAKKWMVNVMIPIDWFSCLLNKRKRQFSSQIVKSMFEESLYDNSKIKLEIGYEFIPIHKYIQDLKFF